MVIDLHAHIFPDKMAAATLSKLSSVSHVRPFTGGTADGLRVSMKQAGIDRSVVLPVATKPEQVTSINDQAVQLKEEEGLIRFGCIHPDFPQWKQELDRIAAQGVKGIKIHPVYQGTDLDDIRYLRILERAGELGLIVVTHTGIDIGYPSEQRCTPRMALRAVEQVGPVTLVLAHMGGWRNWEEAQELLPQASVYLDTSFSTGKITPLDDGYYGPKDLLLMDETAFVQMVRLFGAKRILFGTDSPWTEQKESLEWIAALPLMEEEKRAILGENARKLLNI